MNTPPLPLTGLQDIFIDKPYLVWYVNDVNKLSVDSIVEHVLGYGDWDDFSKLSKTLGSVKLKSIFDRLKNKKRVNLRPQTVNYFTNYFQRYA